jgi:hypothetical protein
MAEVATAMIFSAPALSATCLYSRSASRPRAMAEADSFPRERVRAPSRTISFSVPITRKAPPRTVSTSTMCRELLPRSMAAIFIIQGGRSTTARFRARTHVIVPNAQYGRARTIVGAARRVLGSVTFR